MRGILHSPALCLPASPFSPPVVNKEGQLTTNFLKVSRGETCGGLLVGSCAGLTPSNRGCCCSRRPPAPGQSNLIRSAPRNICRQSPPLLSVASPLTSAQNTKRHHHRTPYTQRECPIPVFKRRTCCSSVISPVLMRTDEEAGSKHLCMLYHTRYNIFP